jgi:hypothetical protein
LSLQQGHGNSKGCKQHDEHEHRHRSDLPQLAPPQVDMEKLDAIIFVKVLEQGFQILQNSSVPLIWDHVDEWDGGSLAPVLQSATCMSKIRAGRAFTWCCIRMPR